MDSNPESWSSGLLVLVVLLGMLLWLGLWCLICLLLSHLSGWRRLARDFASTRIPSGQRFGMQSVRVGWASYNNCLTLHAGADGLHIAVWRPFRLGHSPLLIPWDALRNGVRRRTWWVEHMHFEVAATGVKLALPCKVVQGRRVKL